MFFGFNKATVVVLIDRIVVELIKEKDVSLINESIDPFIDLNMDLLIKAYLNLNF